MSKVVYKDLAAYQRDWLRYTSCFSEFSTYHFSMSYWWAYNTGVLEQNKLDSHGRKSSITENLSQCANWIYCLHSPALNTHSDVMWSLVRIYFTWFLRIYFRPLFLTWGDCLLFFKILVATLYKLFKFQILSLFYFLKWCLDCLDAY